MVAVAVAVRGSAQREGAIRCSGAGLRLECSTDYLVRPMVIRRRQLNSSL
jgi:hypothetical protein